MLGRTGGPTADVVDFKDEHLRDRPCGDISSNQNQALGKKINSLTAVIPTTDPPRAVSDSENPSFTQNSEFLSYHSEFTEKF